MITVWLGAVGRRRKVQPKIRSRHRHGDLAYFSEYLRDHTPNEAFKYFILSSSYNFNPDLAAVTVQDVKNAEKDGKKHPEMLNRVGQSCCTPSFVSVMDSSLVSRAKSRKVIQAFQSLIIIILLQH